MKGHAAHPAKEEKTGRGRGQSGKGHSQSGNATAQPDISILFSFTHKLSNVGPARYRFLSEASAGRSEDATYPHLINQVG